MPHRRSAGTIRESRRTLLAATLRDPGTTVMLSLRRWWKTAAMSAATQTGDNPVFLLDYALRAFRVAVFLALWRTIFGAGADAPLALETVLTYALLAEAFASQLNLQTDLATSFWQGTITTHFLRPQGLVAQFGSQLMGRWAVDFALFSLPLLALSPWLGVNPWPVSANAGALFVLSLLLSISVGFALDFGFAALTVWLEQPVWLIEFLRRAVQGLLAGSVIPLALLPFGIGGVLEWLPFASLAWAPLAIYTGAGEPLRLLLLQAFWSIALWPVVLLVWRLGRERVVGYGG